MRIRLGNSDKYCYAKQQFCVFVLCLFMMVPSIVNAEENENYDSIKHDVLAKYVQKFSSIQTTAPNKEALDTFCDRLKLVDDVAKLLVRSFESARSDSLDSLLGDIVGVSESVSGETSHRHMVRASEILSEYADRFSQGLSLSGFADQEIEFLRQYYDASVRLAGKYISKRGQVVSAINKQSGIDVLELCLVMPFLHISDNSWSLQEIDNLPDWMKTKDNIAALELFSLQVQRPFSAYQFFIFNNKLPENEKNKQPTYAEYLLMAADSAILHRDYTVAILCLRLGVEQAEKEKNSKAAIELHFRLGELLGNIGHSDLAAKEMHQLMDSYPECDDWGKAAMLRLKYLYEAEDFKAIVAEAEKYQTDARCSSYLPQITYIAWVTHRRLNNFDEAEKLAKKFLKEFPTHSLGADIHFASAMTAMASGEYEEAARLLEIIEYKYPQSRIQAKVKDIRERLLKISDKDK